MRYVLVFLVLFVLDPLLAAFLPKYMSDHVLNVLRSFCPVAHVTCPLLCSCIVCHVILEVCRIFFCYSCVYRTSAVFLAFAVRQFRSRGMFFRDSDRTGVLAFVWDPGAGSRSFVWACLVVLVFLCHVVGALGF